MPPNRLSNEEKKSASLLIVDGDDRERRRRRNQTSTLGFFAFFFVFYFGSDSKSTRQYNPSPEVLWKSTSSNEVGVVVDYEKHDEITADADTISSANPTAVKSADQQLEQCS